MNKNFWKRVSKTKPTKTDTSNLEYFLHDKYDESPLIEIKDLTQKYRTMGNKEKFKVIFENLNFNIYKNDRLALIGGNGVGKTTIVEIISGFKKPTSGKVIKNFSKKKSKISVQFQDLSFPKSLTVKDIIKFVIDLDKNKIPEDEVLKMVDVFELIPIINTKVSKLSWGQQQRLNVILSMINKPSVLFLDEFTTGLDIAIKNNIKKFIIEFCDKNDITLIIISHDIEIMSQMTNRAIILGPNKIWLDAPIKEINKKFGSLTKASDYYIR